MRLIAWAIAQSAGQISDATIVAVPGGRMDISSSHLLLQLFRPSRATIATKRYVNSLSQRKLAKDLCPSQPLSWERKHHAVLSFDS